MVLVGCGIVLVLLALTALIPTDRLPSWLSVYLGVALACAVLVVVVALLT